MLLLSIYISAFSQDSTNSEYPDSYFQNRIVKFQKITAGGITLMTVGIISTVIGVAMIVSTGTTNYQVKYSDGIRSETGDPVGGLGGLITGFGISMAVGGIMLKTIGAKKEVEARNVLLKRQHSIKCTLGRNRIALVYSF